MTTPLKTFESDYCERYSEGDDRADVLERIRENDWACAFVPAVGLGFDRVDVESIIAIVNGENDERDWLGLFLLKNGQVLYVSSGCDYTGWDCQSSGQARLYEHRPGAIEDLTDEERNRLDLGEEYASILKVRVALSQKETP